MRAVMCGDCGAAVDEAKAGACSCGSTSRIYDVTLTESIDLYDGLRAKARHGGTGKPYLEVKVREEVFRKKGSRVLRSMRIDRDNDRYSEVVTDQQSGATVHRCEEPLRAHIGHGAVKKKTGNS